MYQHFIILCLYEAQRVSDDTSIIRSLKLHWQPLFFHTWKAVGRVHYTSNSLPHMKKQRLPVQFRLLMMGGVSPETRWALYKYGIIKFCYIIASCWIFLYESYYDARIHEHQGLEILEKRKVYSPCREFKSISWSCVYFNPLNPELNPISYLLALLGAHHFLHVSRIRVKLLSFRLLMSYIYIYIYIYIYGAPILDVSRSHTTTQHSR